MNLFGHDLDEKSILIIPSYDREYFLNMLKKQKLLPTFKILTFEEFKELITFTYDEKDLLRISKDENIKMEIADIYVKNLHYIDLKKEYKFSSKLSFLQNLYTRYFQPSSIQHYFFKDKKIYAYHCELVKQEIKVLCSFIQQSCIFIPNLNNQNLENKIVYEFENEEEEIDYVAHQIATLIEKQIPLSKIKLICLNNDLIFTCNKIFEIYQLPLQKVQQPLFMDIPFYKTFLEHIRLSSSIQEALILHKKKYDEGLYASYYLSLYSICNLFCDCLITDFVDIISYYFKTHHSSQKIDYETIDFICPDQLIDSDDYVFLIGFNQGIIPELKKDEDFLSDVEKEQLNITLSTNYNQIKKEHLIQFIYSHAHLFMSYHLKAGSSLTYLSPLISELNFKVEKIQKNVKESYSELMDKLNLAKELDNGNINSENYTVLQENYAIPYYQYKNQYLTINSIKIQDKIKKDDLQISYSSLDIFYQCPFHYYLSNILHLNENVDAFYLDIGLLFHYILSLKEPYDFDEIYDHYFDNKKILNAKEQFYLQKLKKELQFLLQYNHDMLQHTQLKNILCETKLVVNETPNLKLKVKGFIDKIMCFEENDTHYVVLIDYKTGNPHFDLNQLEYGLSMQLPIYLYLIRNANLFKNVIVVGFYLQKILQEINKVGQDPIEFKQNNLKLQGYSLADKDILSKFDDTYENSVMIKSLKTKKDQSFTKTSKVLNQDEMDEITSKVEIKIKEAIDAILMADFKIQPKILNNNNISCGFCEYKNICYVKANNYFYITTKDGDEDE